MVTLKDVATKVGVHPSVVSRVINKDNNLKIKQETRERIMKAVEELNYQPNLSARNLKKNETKMLGMVIPDFSNPVYAHIIHGAEDQAASEGYSLLLYSMKQRGLKKNYFSHLLEHRMDGLLIANSEADDQEILNLKRTKKPFILVNRYITGLSNYVILNDEYAGKLATKHLADLGHKRIAHLAGPLYIATGLRRFQGYREGLKEANLEFNSNYVQESAYSIEDGYQSMNNLLNLPIPPSAIFAANIMIAMGAMKAIQDRGLSIPDDISLVGLHDTSFTSAISPALTTVKMPLYEMGVKAVKQLTNVITNSEKNQEGLMIPEATLIIRESTSKYNEDKKKQIT